MLEPRGGHANGLCRQAVAPGLELEERLAGCFEPAHEHIGLARSARVSHRNIDRCGLSVEGRLGHFLGISFDEGIPRDLLCRSKGTIAGGLLLPENFAYRPTGKSRGVRITRPRAEALPYCRMEPADAPRP